MTVIVFDGVTMAADKLAVSGTGRTTVSKIFRFGTSLIGLSGNMSVAMELMAWFCSGVHAEDFPASARDDANGVCMLVVQKDGVIFCFERTPFPYRIHDKKCAIGCGAEMAMVALDLGSTAVKAVEAVSRHNINCGNGVDALNLHDVPDALNPVMH